MIVVDTNVLVYTVVTSPQTAVAQQVLSADPDRLFPPLWRYEFTSAVATLVRGGALSAAQAEDAITEAERLVAGREQAVDQLAALRAAIAFDLSAYDGQYVALAQDRNVRCVTTDRRMLRNAPAVAVSPADFIAGLAGP